MFCDSSISCNVFSTGCLRKGVLLYRVFKKGFFARKSSHRVRYDEQETGMYISQWLTCVLPDLYPFGVQK